MNLYQKRLEIVGAIKEQGVLSQEQIYKWFGKVPYNVKILVRDFQFDKRRVLDIRCSYGNSLLYWGNGSEGVEIQEDARTFLERFGIKTYALNVEDGFEQIEVRYESIYANNLIEHLVAPHLFLVRLHRLLETDGILAVSHPVTPACPFDKIWGFLGYRGWLASEHINFYTVKTISHTLERSGFRILRQYIKPFDRVMIERVPVLKKLLEPLCIGVLSVCHKLDKYKYPPKRLEKFDPFWARDCKILR